MKHLFKPRVSGLLLTLLLFAGGTQTALAAGTASGVTISNIATVNYEVGGLGQTAILSSPLGDTPTGINTDFVVDNKVDLTVANLDGGTITVAPGSTVRVLTFSVTNDGNTPQGYLLSVVDGALAIPMGPPVEIWIDDPSGLFPGVYDLADTLYVAATNAGDLDPNTLTPLVDAVMTVFIVADTPIAAVDATVDNYSLLATTTNLGTAVVTVDTVANTAAGVEVVFVDAAGTAAGDAANDGTHSDTGSYTVASATLTVTKSAVVLDIFGGSFAIPGSTVTYTITVANTGGTAATSVVISDAIPVNSTYFAASITLDTVAQSDGLPGIPADTSDYDVTTANAVTVNIDSLAAGATATITFRVTID